VSDKKKKDEGEFAHLKDVLESGDFGEHHPFVLGRQLIDDVNELADSLGKARLKHSDYGIPEMPKPKGK
jgi:hypothetical protein